MPTLRDVLRHCEQRTTKKVGYQIETERMIDWGVDGIITDDPARLTAMLAARGLRVPARY